MKKKILSAFAIVAIFAINLFTLQEEESQDYSFLNMPIASAYPDPCWDEYTNETWIGDCLYYTSQCTFGGNYDLCLNGFEMTCPDDWVANFDLLDCY